MCFFLDIGMIWLIEQKGFKLFGLVTVHNSNDLTLGGPLGARKPNECLFMHNLQVLFYFT